MTTKQKAAIAVAMTMLKQSAQNLADAPARAKAEAKDAVSPLGTGAFEAGWLGGSCGGAAKQLLGVVEVLASAFPGVKEVA